MIDYNRDAHIFPEMQNDKFSYYRQMAFDAWGGDDLLKPRYPIPKHEEPDHSYVECEVPEKKTLDVYDVIYTGKIIEVFFAGGYGLCVRVEATTMQDNQAKIPVKKSIKPTEVTVILRNKDGYEMCDNYGVQTGDYAQARFRHICTKGICKEFDFEDLGKIEDQTTISVRKGRKRAFYKAC